MRRGSRRATWCPPTADCAIGEPLRDGALLDPETGRSSSIAGAPAGVVLHRAVVLDGVVYVPGIDADASTGRGRAGRHLGVRRAPAGRGLGLLPEDHRRTVLPDDLLSPSFDREAVWLGDRLLLAGKDLVASPWSARPALVRLAELDAGWTTWHALPERELPGWDATVVGDHAVRPQLGSADGGEVNGWGRSYTLGGALDPSDGSWRAPSDLAEESAEGRMPAATVGGRIVVGAGLLDPATPDLTRAALPVR